MGLKATDHHSSGGGATTATMIQLSHISIDEKSLAGFLTVPYSATTDSTVEDLEQNVASNLPGLRVVYISYRGVRLTKDTVLSYLMPNLHQDENINNNNIDLISSPRFAVHTASGRNVFFVKSIRGNSIVVDGLPLSSTTVQELQEEVQSREGIPAKHQRFIFEGKQLSNSPKTLGDYGVQKDSTVQLLLRLRGGGAVPASLPCKNSFVDISNRMMLMVKPYGKVVPTWRHLVRGLNIEGLCMNSLCKAYLSMVICQKGFTAFNVVVQPVHCPACKKQVKATTCSFSDCLWMFEGRKADPKADPKSRKQISGGRRGGAGNVNLMSIFTNCFKSGQKEDLQQGAKLTDSSPPAAEKDETSNKRVVSPWYKAEKRYEYFAPEGNMVDWEYLIITAKERPTAAVPKPGNSVRKQQERVVAEDSCSICFQDFKTPGVWKHTTACGHTFHADCVGVWKASGGVSCPICRENIQGYDDEVKA